MFAVGASMGACLLVNMLGFDGQRVSTNGHQNKSLVDGAFVLSTPMKLWICQPNFQKALFGFYHKQLAKSMIRFSLNKMLRN